MKILFPIRAFYPSQVGGPCNTLYWHTCELTKRSIDVSVVTTSRGIPEGVVKQDQFLSNECGSVYYGKGNSSSITLLLKTAECIKKADIIHLSSLFQGLAIFSFFFVRFLFPHKKIVWSPRGELNSAALRFSKWKKLPILFFYKRMIKNVVFHATSEQEKEDIKRTFPKTPIILISNFVRRYDAVSVNVLPQILFMGRIHPIKCLHHLIEGLSLSKQFLESEFRLIICGSYEDRHSHYYDSLIELIAKLGLSNRVEFRGHVGGSEKQKIYAESYVLFLPSETENFGNVVAEALNQGTPVIASKGTPWEILEKNKCGFHINNSPKEIATFLDKMINMNSDEYNKYRENAKRLVVEKLDVSKMTDVWINSYRDLI